MLELAIARTLFDRFPAFSEGRMAKIRSHVVSRASCAIVSRELGARRAPADRVREPAERRGDAARAEPQRARGAARGGARRRSTSSTASSRSRGAIVEAFEPQIEFALTSQFDHKTDLQERLARSGRAVNYIVLEVAGPPHDRTFTAAAVIDSQIVGTGSGRSKKDAEQSAARQALAVYPAPDEG